ncbi:UV-stimulated scaffold A-like protein [Chlorella sorokiniana]|uniref:UV-stimulated scaffold A-like protein n=1 Tax=Chlorella sorokiniana TaxID=3076 RepID=A0A2P6TX49_CHLSO|nr:UV-stimulated scaffold A-like protein [Chlorella sorokiniana]|eukprot:PRW58637.1 UV-stimulated scaffold A-like protein [Chlorella sorokiniana]
MSPRIEDAQHRLEGLVARACAKQQTGASLDPSLLSDIKALCRQSDDNVQLAWEALWGQLRASHAQSRLLALLLCEQLFQRSRAFRHALLGHLSQFLEAVVGFRADRPLPPPAHTAASLREKALELLELWDRDWGAKYKQLPLAVRYLRETLQYRFPELAPRAAAAAAERAAREERQRAALRQRLGALLGSSGEWREGAAAARQLLREMDECFAILQEQQQAGADGLQWEDVGAEEHPAAGEPADEGLAAYAAGDGAPIHGEAAADGATTAAAAGGSAETEAVTETLAGLYRQLTNRTLPQLQDWLSVLGRADPEGPSQEAEQQRVLRAATELRGRLAAAKERCDAMDLDLQALLLRRQRREAAEADGQRGGSQQHSGRQQDGSRQSGQEDDVEVVIHELFGDSDSEEEPTNGSRRPAQRPQNTAAGPAGGRQQQGRAQAARGQRQRPARPADDDFESPYICMVDPTMAQRRPAVQLSSPQQQQQQQSTGQAAAARRSSSLPEEVRKKLAAQAPVLPTGPHTLFWDSKSVPTFVSGHGLEVSNHWGPVDVHQELPPERVDELFMLPMPGSRPSAAGQGGQAARRPGQQQAERERERLRQQREAQRAAEQQEQQQQQGDQAGTSAAAQLAPWPSQQGNAAAAGGGPEGRAAKRARRAEERAYNEAVISGALSDELLARQLADADAAAAQAGGQRTNGGRRGRQAKKISVKSRLAQKLLRGGVVAAAVREQQREEGEVRREKFNNRW